MAPAGYEKLAQSVLDIINNNETQYERSVEATNQTPHNMEADRSQQRDAWVARSDAVLQRHYPSEPTGRGGNWSRPWGGYGNRGGSGWRARNRGGRRGYHPY